MWRYIDHRGTFWPLSDLRERYRLTQFPDNHAAHDWAVKNIGLILIGEVNGSLRVRLRPAATPAVASAELLYTLAQSQHRRISISSFDGGWRHLLFPSPKSAVEHTAELFVAKSKVCSKDLLIRDFDANSLVTKSELRVLFERWRSLHQQPTTADIFNLIPDGLTQRFIVLESVRGSDRLIFKNIGNGLRVFDPRWVARAIGRDAEDQPDLRYACWVAKAYRRALQSRQPIAGEVDAIVFDPYRGTRNRTRYRRLVVPVTLRNGRALILGCSTLDSTIDLRRKAG
jgi:hypothetical protein